MEKTVGPMDDQEQPKIPIRDRRKLAGGSSGGAPEDAGSAGSDPADASGPAAGAPGPSSGPSSETSSQMEAQLAEARAQAAGHLEDLQRLKAEFDNYRKRMLREHTELLDRASVGLVARLLNVLDNFDLAVASAEESKDFERMLKGVEMVFGEFNEVLRGEGLEVIQAKGQSFDPNLHEAAVEVPGDGSGRLVVEDVLRQGYLFKGKVLRPAMVKVTQRGDDMQEDEVEP